METGEICSNRKYKFSWNLLGNIELGRPSLGNTSRLEVYRLMQFTLKDVFELSYGTNEADRIFFEAGRIAGVEFYKNVLEDTSSFGAFIRCLQESFRNLGIGVLRVEKSDLEKGYFVLTVSEDMDCSGLLENDYPICTYDEGFISALMESFTGRRFKVKEIDCWCTGGRICRFVAEALG